MSAVSLFNNACREQIGEQLGREQITVLLYIVFSWKSISPLIRAQLSSLTYKYYLNSRLFTLSLDNID